MHPDNELFELVIHLLQKRLSPEQIASKLRAMELPNLDGAYACHETTTNAIYALPVGE